MDQPSEPSAPLSFSPPNGGGRTRARRATAWRTGAGAGRPLALWLAAGIFGLSGCTLGPPKPPEPPPAPPAPPARFIPPSVPYAYGEAFARPPSADGVGAGWSERERQMYLARLDAVAPPVHGPLTVLPKAPRRPAWQSEFENDDAWRGPPVPELPPLPGDRPAWATPAVHRGDAASAPSRFAMTTGESGSDTRGAPTAPEGVDPETARLARLYKQDFRPVEQLVYGGIHEEATVPDPYRLQPRDRVRVTVRNHPELSGEMQVGDDGRLPLPGAPDILSARGKTLDALAASARLALTPYLRDGAPEVRVEPLSVRGGYYYVFGAVRNPGRFPMGTEPVRLSEAVLAANWETLPSDAEARQDELGPAFPAAQPRGRFAAPATADLTTVRLYTPHRSRPAKSVHDIEAALLRGAAGDDPFLRPGQVVVVPSTDPAENSAWDNRDSRTE